jgi:hypothetical protein
MAKRPHELKFLKPTKNPETLEPMLKRTDYDLQRETYRLKKYLGEVDHKVLASDQNI